MTPDELAKLTPEQKRIKIAEVCGYGTMSHDFRTPPDYLNDLNAMREAQGTLSAEYGSDSNPAYSQRMRFSVNLCRICWPESLAGGTGYSNMFDVMNASAAQRADAFLLTIG